MKTFKQFKQYLGPEATKQQDAAEIKRQKNHLSDKAKEYYDQGAREGGQGAAIAKGITMDLAKKNIKEAHGPWGKMTQDKLDKIAKSKKREEKEKGLMRKPGSSMSKNTMNYIDKVDKLSEEEEVDEACWTGYTAKGMKKKGNRMVPNCVPEETVQEDGVGGVPTNNVGGGNIAGSGGTGGEPGVSKKRNPVMSFLKRKQTKM